MEGLRLLVSALKYKEIEARGEEITEEMEIGVLRGELKKRKEAKEIYEKAGERDRAEQERFELELIEKYLPQLLGEEDLKKEIRRAASESDKRGGELIGEVMRKLKGRADGGIVAKLVGQLNEEE